MRTLDELGDEARACTRCRLHATAAGAVFGAGDVAADVMVVGEAPGREEDQAGRPFVGRSGRLLDRLLAEAGIGRERCYVTNVVKHRPPGNRDPKPDEVAACRAYLDGEVGALGPRVVVTLGNFATRALLGTREGVTALRGRAYPFGAASLVPTFHPSYALRHGAAAEAGIRADLERARDLVAAEPGP